LRRKKDLPAALAIVNTGVGRRYMVALRNLIGQIKRQQITTFGERLRRQELQQEQLEVALSLAVLVGALLVYLSIRFGNLYARERDLMETELKQLNTDLELRVRLRTADLESRTRELEHRTKELQRSNADLTQFAYVASHDLREPLRMVGSYMGLLSRRYGTHLDETAQGYIQYAIDGATRMQALINDLLSYSSAGTQALDVQNVPMAEVVRTALQNLDVAVRESGAHIRYDNLPTVCGDRKKLEQVMQNLIGNAIKFRKADVEPVISITSTSAGREWVFAVQDNGIGFDAKYQDRIYQVFQRLHGVGRYPGNGIGLAICRRIIEHHGGRLWAQSEPNLGSTFLFTIPTATDYLPEVSNSNNVGVSQPVVHA
jgi:light-regulated signal transduction histidine kinase (bacteriophytochrome)